MARSSSCTLDLQEFIPYPVKVLNLKDIVNPPNSNYSSRKNQNLPSNHDQMASDTTTITECPFDCCQKNLQEIYFPNCDLTNAKLKMKITSGDNRNGRVSRGIPCLEGRQIYQGRVTEMPIKFEELIKEAQGEDILIDRNTSSNLSDKKDLGILRLTFHQQVASSSSSGTSTTHSSPLPTVSPKETKRQSRNNDQQQQNQYHYVWDTEKCGWTWTKSKSNTNTNSTSDRNTSDQCKISNNNNNDPALGYYYQTSDPNSDQSYWEKRDFEYNLWLKQQQFNCNPTQPFRKQGINNTSNKIESTKPSQVKGQPSLMTSSSSSQAQTQGIIENTESFVDQQLSTYLKTFKYVKPSSSPQYSSHTNSNIINPTNNPGSSASITQDLKPLNTYNSSILHSSLKPSLKQPQQKYNTNQQQEAPTLKRSISPKAALEQFEHLKKYWDYQHQLLEADDYQNDNERGRSNPYGQTTPAKLARTNNSYFHQKDELRSSYGTGPNNNSVLSSQSMSSPGPFSLVSTRPQNFSCDHFYYSMKGEEVSSSPNPTSNLWGQSGHSNLVSNRNWDISVKEIGSQSQSYRPIMTTSQGAYSSLVPNQTNLSRDRFLNRIGNSSLNLTKKKSKDDISLEVSNNQSSTTIYKSQNLDHEAMNNKPPLKTNNEQDSNKKSIFGSISEIVPLEDPKNISENSSTSPPNKIIEQPEGIERQPEGIVKPLNQTISLDEVNSDVPTDMRTPRRNSDEPISPRIQTPERSKSNGSINEMKYDHIVLLDKRIKTYMCKRCLETLKSEQEIRNHLFCKMLNNTVQCHICRDLFSTDEYTQHLKIHKIQAK